ncbi:hypothetical protein JYU34_006025 [Plutella xylostella]|uniref:Uncharacterized protein n=1 Tax=Plutella xylostella TaxID=51655 RepID=A0ABQ7QUR1_PLUXY|nr:hypothetical protein JYU34_006025 [Plutella xylostella]
MIIGRCLSSVMHRAPQPSRLQAGTEEVSGGGARGAGRVSGAVRTRAPRRFPGTRAAHATSTRPT